VTSLLAVCDENNKVNGLGLRISFRSLSGVMFQVMVK